MSKRSAPDDNVWELKNKYNVNPYRAIVVAAKKGNYDDVVAFLDSGDDINIKFRGTTALMEAIINKRKNIVRLLLDRNANVNIKTGLTPLNPSVEDGRKALHYAIQNEDKDLIREILNGTETRAEHEFDSNTYMNGVPLFPTCFLSRYTDDPVILDMIIEAIKETELYSNMNRFSRAENKWFPLHYAVKCCRVKLVKYLILQENCDVNMSRERQPHSMTYAIGLKYLALNDLKTFKKESKVSGARLLDLTEVAAAFDEIIKLLWYKVKDGLNYSGRDSQFLGQTNIFTEVTPLQMAITLGDLKTVELLLTHPRIDVNVYQSTDTPTQQPPLILAIKHMFLASDFDNRKKIFETILNDQKLNIDGIIHPLKATLNFLKESGTEYQKRAFDIAKTLINNRNILTFQYYLKEAVILNFTSYVDFVFANGPRLFETIFYPNIYGVCIDNVVKKVNVKKNMSWIQKLFSFGSKVEYVNDSPLCNAVSNLKLFQFLKEKYNFDYNARDLNGYTPLMVALASNHVDTAKYLLTQPDINIDTFKLNSVDLGEVISGSYEKVSALQLAEGELYKEIKTRCDPFIQIQICLSNLSFWDMQYMMKRLKKENVEAVLKVNLSWIHDRVFQLLRHINFYVSRRDANKVLASSKFLKLCELFPKIKYHPGSRSDPDSGFTPIFYAIMGNHRMAVESLLNIISEEDMVTKNYTVLHIAIESQTEIFLLLLKKVPGLKENKNWEGNTITEIFKSQVKDGLYREKIEDALKITKALGLSFRRLDFFPEYRESGIERYDNSQCAICLNKMDEIVDENGLVYEKDNEGNQIPKNIPLESMEKIGDQNKYLIPGTVRLPCGHGFHRYCIGQWASNVNQCPLCKREFNEEYLDNFSECCITIYSAEGTTTSRVIQDIVKLKF